MFARLGRFTYRRRRLVMVAWAVLFVAGMALSGPTMTRLATDMNGSDRFESAEVQRRLEEIRPNGGTIAAVVDGQPVDDPSTRAAVEAAVSDVRGMSGVLRVLDHYGTGSADMVAADGGASLVLVELADGDDAAIRSFAAPVADRLRAIEAPEVVVGGDALMSEEFQHAIERDLMRGEMIAIPVAFLAMIVIFGGLRAAGMPMLVAFTAVAGAILVLLAATGVTTVSIFAINVVTMFGIGLGIDYGLLLVSRFREQRVTGATVSAAVERTVETAGRTVLFSALTVAVALAGLFAFDQPGFTSFGIAGIGVVLVALASSLTLLPALLGAWGHKIRPARPNGGDHGAFARLANFVQKRAVVVVTVVTVVLVALAIPFLGATFEIGDARSLPRSSESREVALTLANRFPAHGAEPVVVVADGQSNDPALARLVQDAERLSGVAAVTVRQGTPAGTTIIDVVPAGPSQGRVAESVVSAVRDLDTPLVTSVGGVAAAQTDMKAAIADRLPLALAIIAAATFVLLFLMTGSIAVPLKAIAMNLLSLGASFGALVWVFQDGNLSGVLGFDPVGSVDLFMPVLIFIFAFGLSMDYEVFLLARIKEVYDETGDNDLAVAVGLQRTGRIITSAAFLIVVVFAGFAAGEVLSIKQLGFGLALAVIVDATIVRSLLVPATMKLLGRWNWWAPAPLRSLHARFGLHEGMPPAPVGELTAQPA
jgi:putative drug exporter of the RND superfamily